MAHSTAAEQQAGRVLYVLDYLLLVVRSGGHVTERHLSLLLNDTAELMLEVGGFDEVMRRAREGYGLDI